jgi:L-threonylcarbamoyladenylate synthase
MDPSAEILPCGDAPLSPALRERVSAALHAGAVVGVPTETVYGLAVRADDEKALGRLNALKARDPKAALTWHVGKHAALERFGGVSAMARRLAERYWPGPLTLVLPGVPPGLERGARDGWTGVRLPAHVATADLLAGLDLPIVVSSANASGATPLLDASAVAAAFGRGVEFVLDGGRARLGEGSVVLRVGPGHFDLLRPGILDLASLRETAGRRIAFVCTGNTCRSPMAEGLARSLVARKLGIRTNQLADFGFHFQSLGLAAVPGAPAAAHAVTTLAAREIDISAHRSQSAVAEDLAAFDEIYTLTARHLETLRRGLPPGRAAHCSILDPDGHDVPDPIGGSLEDYARTAEKIADMLAQRLPDWV